MAIEGFARDQRFAKLVAHGPKRAVSTPVWTLVCGERRGLLESDLDRDLVPNRLHDDVDNRGPGLTFFGGLITE